jgi:hypothetical protein
MQGKFTREERMAGYLTYTAIGMVAGTIAALAKNSLYTGGWPLPFLAGALGAVSFYAVDHLTKATPKSQGLQEQADPEHSQLQNLRIPGDTPDHHQQNPDDQSGMGATARNPDQVPVVKKPEQEKQAPIPTLKPFRTKVKPHLPMPPTGRQGPHPTPHVAQTSKPTDIPIEHHTDTHLQHPSDNHMER